MHKGNLRLMAKLQPGGGGAQHVETAEGASEQKQGLPAGVSPLQPSCWLLEEDPIKVIYSAPSGGVAVRECGGEGLEGRW